MCGAACVCLRNADPRSSEAEPDVPSLQFTQVWVNATKTMTQEEAVMEAIFTRGPMTVSVNAEPEDWKFYKSGIYVNKQCSPKLKKLDHAVVVSG